jgi:DNA mismatch endonuclease Vsr
LLRRLGCRFRLHVRIPVVLSASTGDLSYLGSNERNLPKAKARYGPSERARASHWKKGEVSKKSLSRVTRHPSPRFVCPDIVLSKHKTAIFVHGCFWHRHRGCKNCTTPTHRREWWLKKLEGNAARDKLHQRALRQLGWRPMVIWECQTEKPKTLDCLRRKL